MHDIIVIGGGCAGLTAALYAARSGKSVLVIEADTIGGQITAAPLIENYPAAAKISGMEFADRLFEQASELGVEFELDRVTDIIDGDVKKIIAEDGLFEAKAVIIATGSKHRRLGVEGEKHLTGHGVSYCAVCDGAFFRDKTVIVAGGGNTAMADALYLSAVCKKVYVVHRSEKFRADKSTLSRVQNADNTEIITDAVIKKLHGEERLEGVTVEIFGEERYIEAQGLFAAVGRIPQNDIFAKTVKLDENGYILAGEDCKTSAEGIFAAGDCRAKTVRQLTTATADGTCAATAAADF